MTEAERKPTSQLWTVRPTTGDDHSLVANLITRAPERHLHLDWYTTYDLLDESPSLIALEEDTAVGILACPPDPAGIGWIRYFAVREGTPREALWELLWGPAQDLARSAGIHTIAALVTQAWFIPILQADTFSQTTEVIFLEWAGEDIVVDLPLEATLRKMSSTDLAAVAGVDQLAFRPLWQHSLRALEAAFELSTIATVIEMHDRVVAYQMSTASALGAHLARLAVEPSMQGQGLAKALVAHAIRQFNGRGIFRMSVNTQADNNRSQKLYEKLGFAATGQRFPVFTCAMEAT